MAGVISDLKSAVLTELELIRDHLETNPPRKDRSWMAAGPRRADREGLRIGEHRPAVVGSEPQGSDPPLAARIPDADPALTRLKELLAVLDQIFIREPETVATVAELSRLTKQAVRIVDELGQVYKFDSIQLPATNEFSPDRGVKGFSEIRSAIVIVSKFFARLEFYSTTNGKAYLRGVVEEDTAGEDGLINVKGHHYEERIDPLAATRFEFKYGHYLWWAQGKYGAGFDPVDHIVEYIIDLRAGSPTGMGPTNARLGTSKDLTQFIKVQIRSSVPGDEQFSRGELSRMWTYQVKVAKDSPHNDPWVPGWKWTEEAWAKHAIGLPTLRVVESMKAATQGRASISDFTKGSLYAIDEASNIYCFGTSKFHTALSNSAPVAAAGILVAEAGRVVAIDNRSGHYQPGFHQLLTAVKYLKSNLVLEADSFVSLHVTTDDAMYFSPEDFIAVAESGLRYVETAAKIAEIARKYGRLLPVPPRHAHLIPPKLANFPNCGRGDRWDLMLTNMYEPLARIVKDLTDFLESITGPIAWGSPSLEPDARDHEGVHRAEAQRVLQRIKAGGAVCELRGLVHRLMSISQPTAPDGQGPLIAASLKYQNIAMELATLGPSHNVL
jgi:hypothetical protein